MGDTGGPPSCAESHPGVGGEGGNALLTGLRIRLPSTSLEDSAQDTLISKNPALFLHAGGKSQGLCVYLPFFFFGLRDLSSPTRDQTFTP